MRTEKEIKKLFLTTKKLLNTGEYNSELERDVLVSRCDTLNWILGSTKL